MGSIIVNILHFVTVIIVLVAANFASKGNFITDISKYPTDIVFLIAYVYLARKLVIFTLKQFDENKKLETIFVPFTYFYIVFSSYLDGYVGGWSHTDSLLGKLAFIVMTPILMLLTFYVPAIIFIVALFYSSTVSYFHERYPWK